MDVKAVLNIAMQVLKDKRVIFIAVAVILYLAFFISIASYRKKPKKNIFKKKKTVAAMAKKEASAAGKESEKPAEN